MNEEVIIPVVRCNVKLPAIRISHPRFQYCLDSSNCLEWACSPVLILIFLGTNKVQFCVDPLVLQYPFVSSKISIRSIIRLDSLYQNQIYRTTYV